MGCVGSREVETNEFEKRICDCEQKLGFYKLHSDLIDSVFKRYSLSSKMSASQFLTACREMKLNNEYGPLEHPVTKFYNSFKRGNNFDQRKLSALGILLGSGDNCEKAKILFKIYDDSKDGNLDIGEIRSMLDDIIEIGLILLPTLSLNSAEDEETKQDIQKFNKKLYNIQYSIKNFFEIVIMRKDDEYQAEVPPQMEFIEGPECDDDIKKKKKKRKIQRRVSNYQITDINLDQFIEKFDKKNMESLCDAHKLRKMAIEFYSQTVAPRELVKDYILESNKTRTS